MKGFNRKDKNIPKAYVNDYKNKSNMDKDLRLTVKEEVLGIAIYNLEFNYFLSQLTYLITNYPRLHAVSAHICNGLFINFPLQAKNYPYNFIPLKFPLHEFMLSHRAYVNKANISLNTALRLSGVSREKLNREIEGYYQLYYPYYAPLHNYLRACEEIIYTFRNNPRIGTKFTLSYLGFSDNKKSVLFKIVDSHLQKYGSLLRPKEIATIEKYFKFLGPEQYELINDAEEKINLINRF